MNPLIYAGLPERKQYLVMSRGKDVVLRTTLDLLDVSIDDYKSSSRVSNLSDCRSISAYMLRRFAGITWVDIALLQNRHHSSIIYQHETYLNRYQFDTDFRKKAKKVEYHLKSLFPDK